MPKQEKEHQITDNEGLSRGPELNQIIYKFLHPILKFSGNTETINQLARYLRESEGTALAPNSISLYQGKELYEKLELLQKKLKYVPSKVLNNEVKYNKVMEMSRELEKIQNTLHHHLNAASTEKILETQRRDILLWVMEELSNNDFFSNPQLKDMIGADLLLFFQGMLLHHLLRSTNLLQGEARILEQEMETLRARTSQDGERRYSFQKTDFGKLVEKNLELYNPIFAEKEMEIQYKNRGNLTAEVSKSDVERIICNLLHNGAKYSYDGKGRFLKVKARELQPQDAVELSIESFGTPITQEEITKGYIFRPGYRGKFAFGHYREGTGTGLADAKEVVEAHGGTIAVTSNPRTKESNPPTYKIPYLTTLTLTLPKKNKQ